MKKFSFFLIVFLSGWEDKPAVNKYPINISGIYPQLAMSNSAGRCCQRAVVACAGRLWAITCGLHYLFGSDDKLYEIDDRLGLFAGKENTGGTPANRMIYRPAKQLIIRPYFIDEERNIRPVPCKVMPGRLTVTFEHR